MLKFFRRIRYRLINEDKTRKYFQYAIGEIILIIVGVLVALSVAEWNSARKNQSYEIKVLSEISKDLDDSLGELERTISYTETRIAQLVALDSLLKNDNLEYDESLDPLFAAVWLFAKFDIERAQYESLKSKGLDLIKSDKLRSDLITVYEEVYNSFESLNKTEDDINNIAFFDYHMKHFNSLNWGTSIKPNDFQRLKKDNYYKNLVYTRLISLQFNQINSYRIARNNMINLKSNIDEYINK